VLTLLVQASLHSSTADISSEHDVGNFYAGFFEEIRPENFRAQINTNVVLWWYRFNAQL
jgi:hypothetical protein